MCLSETEDSDHKRCEVPFVMFLAQMSIPTLIGMHIITNVCKCSQRLRCSSEQAVLRSGMCVVSFHPLWVLCFAQIVCRVFKPWNRLINSLISEMLHAQTLIRSYIKNINMKNLLQVTKREVREYLIHLTSLLCEMCFHDTWNHSLKASK
ncbi:hypothetical protein Fmac_032030 [Flemingia macrophylla]|uniref:Uncharacterized protein n=1 Tax=Flemingia macrophylla TaxID=520843 RepID=A0ABD1L3R8_9FABA